jgi:hypothetical protein
MAGKTSEWVVTTSGERSVGEVAKELKKHGFKVNNVLDEIGVITGAAEDHVVAKARKVKGVSDVSANVDVDIGPPGSKHTW